LAEGSIHFGEVVERLKNAGVDRYGADYKRTEATLLHMRGRLLHRSEGACARSHRCGNLGIKYSEVEASFVASDFIISTSVALCSGERDAMSS